MYIVEEQYSSTGTSSGPTIDRTYKQNIRPTNEPYVENSRFYDYEATTKPFKKNRIPYIGIEQINIARNILNLDHVDPQDWKKK